MSTEWKKQKIADLTAEQYDITQNNGTEASFKNAYWDNHQKGIYVDILSGTPLFSSTDKYESGCGWPSFTKPINIQKLIEKQDLTHQMNRIEIRTQDSNIHLGHLFNDGPKDKGGLRYCINSAALRFIPYEQMEMEGYQDFLALIK